MAVNVPDLTGGGTPGQRGGITGGPAATPTTSVAVTTATQPNAPQKTLATRWRPESLLDFHRQLESDPEQASRTLDRAIQLAYQNCSQLENMVSCTQFGKTVVTGSQKNIPTGLATVTALTVSIDNGATAHNFWVSGVISAQPGCIDIYCWQPTAANNVTPIATTGPLTIRWAVRGTLQ